MKLHAAREGAPEFILLTGSLGSGKTTLLSDYLSLSDSADTGVIVNEAGEINVDGAVISGQRQNLPITLLSNGCVCCSLGDDLHVAIDQLLAARRQAGAGAFQRIVLETSGLAMPGPILRSLMAYDRADYRIRIVSTLDPLDPAPGGVTPAIRAAQLTAATTMVVTKADVADSDRITKTLAMAAALNPAVRPIYLSDRASRARSTFCAQPGDRHAAAAMFSAVDVRAHENLQVFLADWPGAVRWDDVRDWLEDLAGFCGDRLLRIKGFLSVEGSAQPVLIDGVGTAFANPRPVPLAAPPRTGLVIITHDVELAELVSFSAQSLSVSKPEIVRSRAPAA